ncbi:hypothetical protein EKL30_02015 [Candidimonas sp. SYP-B2681]|uniref:NAD(P)-dependent oxidoreductase n=1 Tax=Candidimonas sp. SYP-B2681 TaxID=2497686 RepID=UPI000F89CD5F|nr:NAD(P)-dependent oxidoreductase [Candidimonas sp. SYP-B2681]RTZ47787.1 hypothetical protein EKL30_02015 [Candidimonas sp. SYP-B2681]
MKILITHYDFQDSEQEKPLYRDAEVEVATVQCRNSNEGIATSAGCQALLLQYASVFPADVERVNLHELFKQADAISLHSSLHPERASITNKKMPSLKKPGSVLVNTSRGPVVDIEALPDTLNDGHLDAAALDVLPDEPPSAQSRVVQHPQVLLSPHAAFYSTVAQKELRRKAAQNLIHWANRGVPTYVVVEGRQQIEDR